MPTIIIILLGYIVVVVVVTYCPDIFGKMKEKGEIPEPQNAFVGDLQATRMGNPSLTFHSMKLCYNLLSSISGLGCLVFVVVVVLVFLTWYAGKRFPQD